MWGRWGQVNGRGRQDGTDEDGYGVDEAPEEGRFGDTTGGAGVDEPAEGAGADDTTGGTGAADCTPDADTPATEDMVGRKWEEKKRKEKQGEENGEGAQGQTKKE